MYEIFMRRKKKKKHTHTHTKRNQNYSRFAKKDGNNHNNI